MDSGRRAPERTGAFLRANAPWLGAGFALALGSSFGQTYFIGLFSGALREEFGLSHGAFGALYMGATLASAAALVQLGRLADHMPARRLALLVTLAFGLVCLGMAAASSVWMLGLLIFGLRLCGQGMLSHLSQTAMARWFAANRGRALMIAAFGYPLGEALLPPLFAPLIEEIGWRAGWIAAAALLLALFLPAYAWLLARERARGQVTTAAAEAPGRDGRSWTRGEAMRDPYFWLLALGVLAPSFMLTVVFFVPAHIAEIKGLTLAEVAGGYAFYAAAAVPAAIVAGLAIDRVSARALLPLYLLPMAAGFALLAASDGLAGLWGAMALLGLTAGASSTIASAIWAELYGTRHLGSIKALTHAGMVFSTAAGPGAAGALIDFGVDLNVQAWGYVAYCAAVSALFVPLSARLR